MKCSVVYSSLTGNTAQLAQQIKTALGEDCLLCSPIKELTAPPEGLIFVGYWTDKGSCDEATAEFLMGLHNANVAFFATCGAGSGESYYETIHKNAAKYLNSDCTLVGTFMCQGKMGPGVLKRYQQILEKDPQNPHILAAIQNYKQALPHPDEKDLADAAAFAKKIAQA
jgi:flavodoxin I